jgi:ketosteroid isomerase-like protein
MFKRNCSLVVAAALAASPVNATVQHPTTQSAIVAQIKSDVAEIVDGINSKDIAKATKFDAPDLISMESMRAPSYGAKPNHDGLAMVFKHAPSWHLSMIDEAVDVSKSGDMAVYRSTYNEDSTRDGTPYTHKVNYIAGFRRDADGRWRVHWSVVCAQSPSEKK